MCFSTWCQRREQTGSEEQSFKKNFQQNLLSMTCCRHGPLPFLPIVSGICTDTGEYSVCTCKICADTTTPMPGVYVCMWHFLLNYCLYCEDVVQIRDTCGKKKIKVTLMCIIEYSVSASLSAEMQVFVLNSFCEKSGISASSVKSVPSKYSVSVSVSTEMQVLVLYILWKKKSCIGESSSQNDIEPCPQQKYSTNRKSKQHSISSQQWLTDPQKFF